MAELIHEVELLCGDWLHDEPRVLILLSASANKMLPGRGASGQ